MSQLDTSNIRSFIYQGQPWFLLRDACEYLGLKKNNAGAYTPHTKQLDTIEIMSLAAAGIKVVGNGMNNARIISESGLYKLTRKHKKPTFSAPPPTTTALTRSTSRNRRPDPHSPWSHRPPGPSTSTAATSGSSTGTATRGSSPGTCASSSV